MPPQRLRPWLTFAISWIVLSLLSAAWAIATPLAAAPDEPAHLVKAASVARGQFIGTATPQGNVVRVPAAIAFTIQQTCYAFHPDVDASCIPPFSGDPRDLTDATTTAGLYNPMYYLLVGWPSLLFSGTDAIFAMRIVSGILTSLFLALAIGVVATLRRRWLPALGAVAAITPMVLFLSGTVNPNGLEITATLAVFTAIMAIVVEPDRRLVTMRMTIVAVSGAVAANARGLSLAWLAVAIAIPLFLLGWKRLRELLRERSVIVAISVVGGASIFAATWLLTSNSLAAAIGKPSLIDVPYLGSSPLKGFAVTVEETFDLGQNMIGIFGWLDTPAPVAVMFVWAAFIGTLILLATALLRGRSLVAAIVLALAVVVLPAIFQAAYITSGGFIWQGRYTLPLFVCLVMGIALLLTHRAPPAPRTMRRRVVIVVAASWTIAQLYSFVIAMHRYAVGTAGPKTGWGDFLLRPRWSPPGGVIPDIIAFAVVAVAAGVLITVLARQHDSDHTGVDVAAPDGVEPVRSKAATTDASTRKKERSTPNVPTTVE